MIFKECLAIQFERRISAITGHIVGDGDAREAHPILTVRAVISRSDAVVAETTTTRFGEFRLEVGLPLPASVDVYVVDAGGTRLGESVVEMREPVQAVRLRVPRAMLDRAIPVRPAPAPPALLVQDSMAALKAHVGTLVREGVLDADAEQSLEEAIRPLAWADALMAEARGVLAGDVDSGERLRAALLSLGAGTGPVEEQEPGSQRSGDDAETERPDAQRILDRVGLAQLAAAVIWAVEDPAETRAMLNGLAAVLWSGPWIELFDTTAVESPPFAVSLKPCLPSIVAPVDGAVVAPGELLQLVGQGFWMEESRVERERLHWASSLDGDLGRGASVRVERLSEGRHRITLAAGEGNRVGTESVTVTVSGGGPSRPPAGS